MDVELLRVPPCYFSCECLSHDTTYLRICCDVARTFGVEVIKRSEATLLAELRIIVSYARAHHKACCYPGLITARIHRLFYTLSPGDLLKVMDAWL